MDSSSVGHSGSLVLEARLVACASNQLGVFTVQQAAEAGVSANALYFRKQSGLIVPLQWGVYRLAAVEESAHQHALAACLAGARHPSLVHVDQLGWHDPACRIGPLYRPCDCTSIGLRREAPGRGGESSNGKVHRTSRIARGDPRSRRPAAGSSQQVRTASCALDPTVFVAQAKDELRGSHRRSWHGRRG